MSAQTASISLRLFGPLKDSVGKKEVSLDFAHETVQQALLRFAQQQNASVKNFLFDSAGNLCRSLIVLVNDEPIKDIKTTHIRAGDVISLLLPLAGG